MKLHIGCGKKYLEGWTNLDISDLENKVDIVDDARYLTQIENNSCDIIYASHVLEHFSRHEYENVIRVWVSKLKKGGVLRIAVPNFEAVTEVYTETGDVLPLIGLVCGGQRDSYDNHHMIFDEKMLTESLLSCGFSEVRKWDWRNADHSDTDDYSQAYLPHVDKKNGTLMSLNLEAVR